MNPRTASIIALSFVTIAALIVLFDCLKDDPSPAMDVGQLQKSDGKRSGNPAETKEERQARITREEQVREVKQKQLAFWFQNASAGLAEAKKNLLSDLDLSDVEAVEVERIFALREAELSGLLGEMHSGKAADEMEHLREICDLLRNKGLRQDLAGVLSAQKLASFDANEATRERETSEARAYRDMADINAVVLLTDSQKQQALAALLKNAPVNVEHEADSRAFMTLNYGQMLADVDFSSIRGLANMVSAGLNDEMPDVEIDSLPFQKWTQENKMKRIENELSALKNILDEKQLARYREHLESEPAW